MSDKFDYEALYARSAPPPMRRAAVRRGKYDFAVAYPDPDSIPLEDLADALRRGLMEEGRDLALYPHRQGYPPLREFVAQRLARTRGIQASPDDIILGDGSGQPIYMVAETFLDPGDVVITEDYVYLGTLNTLRRFKADVRGVACDDQGMVPEALEETVRRAVEEGKRPKFIYTIPTFQNPQGWSMATERRRALLEVAHRYGVPVLEDDCYVDLRFEGEPEPSIYSLDDAGMVMYVASFSKIIAPGVRMGYVVAQPEVIERLLAVKSGSGVNQFAALAVHRYAVAKLEEDIARRNEVLRAKRDAMLASLGENFGDAARWSQPQGGLYIWLQLPEGADLVKAREVALEKADVGYIPGPMFAPDGQSGANYARLCFGYNTPEEIREGVARLAEVFHQEGLI